MSKIRIALLAIALAALVVVAGCGSDEDSTSASGDSTSAATVSLSDCTPDTVETKTPGTLTVGTDKPAYPPYFEDDDPTNGEGFESATAYAIADKLGFDAADVKWTVVPFNASFAPGPKDFDFDVNQISITPKREEQVDFSDPYYEAEQAVVVLKNSGLASASSLADLADANIGVQIGTTSLDAVNATIQPTNEPQVFDNSNDVVSALTNGQVDAVVVDVPTAFTIGQFAAPGGDTWGALLEKDSPLVDCVNAAIADLQSSGELPAIEKKWMSDVTKAPVLQ